VELATLPRSRVARVRTVALRVAVSLAVGVALMLVFLHMINLSAVYQHRRHLSVTFGFLSGVAFLGAYSVRGVRWRLLLRPCQVSIYRAIAIYQVATFLNLLLPIQGGVLTRPLARALPERSRDRARPSIVLFVDTLLALLRRPSVLFIATIFTVAAASLDALSCPFAFRAVGVSLALPIVAFGYTFLSLTFI
jgi:Lysylphosphatidylglycerol synthase TM region